MQLAVLDVVPVRAKAATLLGDDPYQSQVVSGAGEDGSMGEEGSFFRSVVSSIERMDLGDKDAEIALPKPGKLVLDVEVE
jgi:hypothetical protein